MTTEPSVDVSASPVYLGSPIADALVHVTVELAAELWVVKRRLHLLETRVGDGAVSLDELVLDDAEVAAGTAAAQEFADRVLLALGRLGNQGS